MSEWRSYEKEKPPVEGHFWWRVSSHTFEDTNVCPEWVAKFRKRGAGYTDVLSPEFDYWDGYRVIVPENLEWRELEQHDKKDGIRHPGVDFKGCPFDGYQPVLKWHRSGGGRGIIVGEPFYRADSFKLSCPCCRIETPYMTTLAAVAYRWNTRVSVST